MRRTAIIMGMPVSIDIPDCLDLYLIESVFEYLRDFDRQFSTYSTTSELSRYRSGRLTEHQLSPVMIAIMRQCSTYEVMTNGYFSAYYDRTFDPTGYTKSLAIYESGQLLRQAGFETWLINIGGDTLMSSQSDKTWQIAIQHPAQKVATIGSLAAKNLAVATSGRYVRGDHILDPHTNSPANELLSVTVRGPDIRTADVFATAVTAMGSELGLLFMNQQPQYEALLVNNHLDALTSTNFLQ